MRESTVLRRCTAERQDRSFCDAPSLPDMPFPICMKHLREIMSTLRYWLDDKIDDLDPAPTGDGLRILVANARLQDRAPRCSSGISERRAAARTEGRGARDHVVYYLRLGEHVKIGYTANLAERMTAYPPMAHLVAVEPGGRDTEAQRHTEFRSHLDGRREWFKLCPELIALMTMLRRLHGEPFANCRID